MSTVCWKRQCVRIACAALLCAGAAQSQTSFGALTGSVADSSGSGIAQVTLKATNTATGVAVQTTTNEAGIYNIFSLIPGEYTVSAEKTGFDRVNMQSVALNASQTTTVNITLKVGKVSESITVTAEAPLLTPTTPTVATTINGDIATSLPYPEVSTLGAALLVAGVTGNPFDSMGVDSENPGVYTGYVTPGAQLAVGGAPPGRSVILVDGSDVTQTSFPRAGISVSGAMLQETTVVVGGIPAQYGRSMGGAIVQATRSGTNTYHGGISWRHTDPGFNAYPLGGSVKSQNHQNFFGIYGGGPIILPKIYDGRNRTFFYVGVEPGRLSNTVTQQGRVPLPSDLQGDFGNNWAFINQTILSQQGAAAALAAPRTGGIYYQTALNSAGFPTGPQFTSASQYSAVPNNNLSAQLAQNPFAKYVLSQFPTPQNPGPYFSFYRPDGLWLNNGYNVSYLRGVNNTDNRWAFRIDHSLTDRDRLFVRFTNIPLTSGRFFGLPTTSPAQEAISDQSWANDTAINETHVVSSAMVNEVRLMYMRNRQLRAEAPAALSKDWAASFNLTPATAGAGFPQIVLADSTGNIFNGPTFGNGNNLQQVDENYQISDDLTWTHNRHTLKFGVDIRRLQSNQTNLNGVYGGGYTFNQSFTNNGTSGGTGLASLILGLVGSYSNTPVEVPNYYRWHYYAGFVQDDFRVSPSLTLNLGLRYEVETPRIDRYNFQGTFVPTVTGMLNGMAATGAYCRSGSCGLSTSLWPTNYTGFEPRVGIAWSPSSRMTVRSSFNLIRIPLTGYSNSPNPNYNVSSNSVGGTTGGVIANQPVDYLTNPVGSLTSALSTYGAGGPYFSVLGITIPFVDQNTVMPYAMQWGATIQYQIDSKTMVQVGYNGLRGVHLITNLSPALNVPGLATLKTLISQGYNFNATSPNPFGITNVGSTTVNSESAYQALSPYQNFYNQSIQELFNRAGGSIYNGLYINAMRRVGWGISIQGSFAWSKSIDDTGGDGNLQNSGFPTSPIQDVYGLKEERSISNFDIPAKLTAAYSWQLPLGSGRSLSTRVKAIDALIGHWSTSGIFNTESGEPLGFTLGSPGYFVSTGGGTSLLPAGMTLRPNIVPGQSCYNPDWRANPFGTQYINQAMFAVPGSLGDPELGNASRTLSACRSPRILTFNASLDRTIPLGKSERRNLHIGATAQNLFNHPVFYLNGLYSAFSAFNTASITNSATPAFTNVSTFGTLNSANTQGVSRVIQVSIKLEF
jgi:hypothetical protein